MLRVIVKDNRTIGWQLVEPNISVCYQQRQTPNRETRKETVKNILLKPLSYPGDWSCPRQCPLERNIRDFTQREK